ncbi:MAG: 5'-deoxynucleotidase [Oscillibacter sp.]|nr:5'-deoxynucleotidase [Oscillibacter sp.]
MEGRTETGVKSHFFAWLFRMRCIRRWALMRNTESENVLEHTCEVIALAHALAVIRNRKFGGHADPGAAAAAALYHDAPEIFTGDLPTPIKYDGPAIREAYKAIEHRAARRLLDTLPEELRGDIAPYLTEVPPETEELVKAADKLAAYIKCVEERKAGNGEFRKAEEQTRAALDAMDLPEVRYFLDAFLDSFSLSLDEPR